MHPEKPKRMPVLVNAALLDDLTGERNVVLGCLAMGMTPQETKDRYQSIVDFSGVGNFIDYPMRTYSTGMAQRLRFSIASAKNHEILMIDEALATGDANFRAKSHERIVQLRGEAATGSVGCVRSTLTGWFCAPGRLPAVDGEPNDTDAGRCVHTCVPLCSARSEISCRSSTRVTSRRGLRDGVRSAPARPRVQVAISRR